MRMWLTNPEKMCRKHLMSEHLGMHMFIEVLRKQKKVDGYINNNLFEPRSLFQRHEDLAAEMKRRGYNHRSPLHESDCFCMSYLPEEQQYWQIDKEKALKDLIEKCPECYSLFKNNE